MHKDTGRRAHHGHPVFPAGDPRDHPDGPDGEPRHPHDHDGHQPARLRGSEPRGAAKKAYEKICRSAARLVAIGEEIEREYGIPIINKRVSVTPIVARRGSVRERRLRVVRGVPRPRRGGSRRELSRRLLGARAQGHDARRRGADRVDPARAQRHGARLRVGERRHHARGHQHGRRRADGRSGARDRARSRRTATASAARSSSCSATRWRTTRSWRVRSMASASPSAS